MLTIEMKNNLRCDIAFDHSQMVGQDDSTKIETGPSYLPPRLVQQPSVSFIVSAHRQQENSLLPIVLRQFEHDTQVVGCTARPASR